MGPAVRIRFPPAKSLQTFSPKRSHPQIQITDTDALGALAPAGVVTVTGGVQRVGEVETRFMRRQPHLASGRHCHGNGRGAESWRGRTPFHATATASCQRAAASALKIRSVDRETRVSLMVEVVVNGGME